MTVFKGHTENIGHFLQPAARAIGHKVMVHLLGLLALRGANHNGHLGNRQLVPGVSRSLGVRHESPVAKSDRLHLGRITASITWITPFLQAMSVFTTLALSIWTLPSATLIFAWTRSSDSSIVAVS